jgi:DNA polymerase-2
VVCREICGLVRDINAWWTRTLHEEQGLENFLEIEFDTHYRQFFMPTIRGSDVGIKKRYAALSTDAAGKEEMVFRGLEMARSDWTRWRGSSRKVCSRASSMTSPIGSS